MSSSSVSVIQEPRQSESGLSRRRAASSTSLSSAAATGKRRLSTPRKHRRRLSSSSSSSCSLSIAMAMPAPAPLLASLRVLVLSHLAELEKRLTASTLSSHPYSPSVSCSPSSTPSRSPSPSPCVSLGLESKFRSLSASELESVADWWAERPVGEETVMDDALNLVHDTLEMLRRIRSDVSSHIPDLPLDVSALEELLRTHLADRDQLYQSLLDELRAYLPDLNDLRVDVRTKLQDVKTHIRGMSSSLDLSQPLNYLPVLSAHLNSLHQRLSSLSAYSDLGPDSDSGSDFDFALPSLPTTDTLKELLDKVLSSDMVPALIHRVDGHYSPLEKAAKEMSEALKKSLDGARLVKHMDVPEEWRSNPWVSGGYRFIPLHKWPIILLSLFALHNETVNIHTHMIPLVHSAFRRFLSALNYASAPLDQPEQIYSAFAMLCLFGSVVWHTMSGCASKAGMELCARVDYIGIGWLISASVGTVVYYGFSCHSQAAMVYMSLCVLTGVAGCTFPFMRWFNDRKYRTYRVAFFLSMAFTGIAPLMHLSYLYSFPSTFAFVGHIAPSFLSYIIGLVFYITHIPERFVALYGERMARWTDWIGGGSHAIWHAFIVLAIYQHKWGMREMRWGVGGERCLVY